MKTITWEQWIALYRAWRADHWWLSKEKRLKIARSCNNKAMYETYADAIEIVKMLPLRPGKMLHAYQCVICKAWHIGNTNQAYMRKGR